MDLQVNAVGSDAVRARIARDGGSFSSSANISQHLRPGDMEAMAVEAEVAILALQRALVIDSANDPHSKDTAARVARMYLKEVFAGRYEQAPAITDFPNAQQLDELYTVGPITVRSCCAHHLCPIEGEAWCGLIPGERLIGLSKFERIARWVLARPTVQEDAAISLTDEIEAATKPLGIAVVIKAHHSCLSWRGVKDAATTMTTSVTRGRLRESSAARAEFFSIIAGQGFSCR